MQSADLTLNPCGGLMVRTDGGQGERYSSLKECAALRNIPFQVLVKAKQSEPLPHHGFTKDGKIKWEELQPYLSTHYATFATSVTSGASDEREALELRKLKQEVIKLENHNKTKSKDFISRKLVLRTITTIYGNVFSQLNRYLVQEMPAKCDGMSANQLKQYNKDYLARLFSGLKKQEKIWAEAKDVNTEDDLQTEAKPDAS